MKPRKTQPTIGEVKVIDRGRGEYAGAWWNGKDWKGGAAGSCPIDVARRTYQYPLNFIERTALTTQRDTVH